MPKFERKMASSKEVVFFSLYVCYGRKKWRLAKRYSDFYDFDCKVRARLGNMPTLPPKTWMPLTLEKDLDERRQQLHAYVLPLAARLDARCNSDFRAFLELEQHVEESVTFAPVKLTELTDLPFGARDMVVTAP